MNKVISVIIPVYNVSNYLKDCLNSVINQTYKDLEIILIDDGSTDGSQIICDEYSNIDKRIKVIHQKNAGAGAAKNTGLQVATGEYLSFVDSDDYLELEAYEFMVNKMEKDNVDIVHCIFKNVFKNGSEIKCFDDNYHVYDSNEYLELFLKDWTCGLLWNKLYKRELYNGIKFKEGRIIDDEFYTYQGVMNSTSVGYYPFLIYNYRQRKSGVMLTESNITRINYDKVEYLTERLEKISKYNYDLKPKFIYNYYEHLFLILKENDCSKKFRINVRKKLVKNMYMKNVNFIILFLKTICLTFKNNKKIVIKNNDSGNYFE